MCDSGMLRELINAVKDVRTAIEQQTALLSSMTDTEVLMTEDENGNLVAKLNGVSLKVKIKNTKPVQVLDVSEVTLGS